MSGGSIARLWARLGARRRRRVPAGGAVASASQPPETVSVGTVSPVREKGVGHASCLDPRVLALVEELGCFAEFSAIMRRHLGNVCTQTENASVEILGFATTIEHRVHALLAYIGTATSSDIFLAATEAARAGAEDGRAEIAMLKAQREARQAALKTEVDTIGALSKEMLKTLAGIERIRMQTDVLAINVTIAIARLGDAAAGLDPLALEIRRLAQQTAELTQDLRRSAGAIDERLEVALMEGLARQAEQDSRSAEKLLVDFDNLSNSMAAVVALQGTMIERVHQESRELEQPLMALCSSLQFQDITRQQVDQVASGLDAVTSHIVDLSHAAVPGRHAPTSSIASCLDAISGGYVMESQRAAHGAPPLPSLAAIELF